MGFFANRKMTELVHKPKSLSGKLSATKQVTPSLSNHVNKQVGVDTERSTYSEVGTRNHHEYSGDHENSVRILYKTLFK